MKDAFQDCTVDLKYVHRNVCHFKETLQHPLKIIPKTYLVHSTTFQGNVF